MSFKKFGVVLAFLGTFAAGFFVATSSWQGLVFVHSDYFQDYRSPAAIKRVFDFSHLEGSALRLASQKRLITDARILQESERVGIELGHFVTNGEGRKQLACEYYDSIRLTFEASGMAENGEKATMEVVGPCLVPVAQDLNRIAPLWIPVSKLLMETPHDKDYVFPEAEGVHMKFAHLGSHWPHEWALTSVKLYHQTEAKREISISGPEMQDLVKRPLRLHF